jgi:hypothetical protein
LQRNRNSNGTWQDYPDTSITFLGIELDTVKQEARLPQDKLSKCLEIICEFLHRKKGTLKELQFLCGLLNFACQVVIPCRAFLRRLFDLTRGLRKPHHTVKLSRGCKDDLLVWKHFIEEFNGKCFFLDDNWITNDTVQLYTDAFKTNLLIKNITILDCLFKTKTNASLSQLKYMDLFAILYWIKFF